MSRHGIERFATIGIAGLVLAVGVLASAPEVRAAANPLRCDFDSDGRTDLAVGVPGDNNGRGAVNVQYSPDGFLSQGAYYGAALAAGDFNEDGSADLAIGAPYSEVTVNQKTVKGAGAVHVILGQANVGLFLPAGQAPLDQSILMATTPRTGELFGYSLAVGDFDGGRGDDLAIGAPFEQLEEDFKNEAFRGYGAVHVVYFSGVGLTISSSDMHMEDEASGFGDAWRDVDRFGFSLAAGNFDGLHSDDLAIGSPGNSDSGRGGAVAVIYSNGLKLSVEKVQFFYPGDFADGIQTPPPSDGLKETDLPEFGGSLAVGDYQGDGVADLFIGVPGYTFDGFFKTDVGAVEIKPGSAGVGLAGSYLLLHQDLFQPNKTWSAAESNASFRAEFWKMTGERFGYAMGQ